MAADEEEGELTLADAINLATRRMATALIVAGAAIGLAIWARPSPPKYQVIETPHGILRVNTVSGTVIACEAGRCAIVLEHGQHVDGSKVALTLPSFAPAPVAPVAVAPAPKALPAPAATPAR